MSGYALTSTSEPSQWRLTDGLALVGSLWLPRYAQIDRQTGGGAGALPTGPTVTGAGGGFQLAYPHGDGTFAGIRVPPGLWYAHFVYQFGLTSWSGEDPAATGPQWMIPNIIDGASAGVPGAAPCHTNGSGEYPLGRNGTPNQWSGVFMADAGADQIVVGFNGGPEFWTADWRPWTASTWLDTYGTALLAVMQVPGGAPGNVAIDALSIEGVFRV